jgi:hypothetical protein
LIVRRKKRLIDTRNPHLKGEASVGGFWPSRPDPSSK